MAPTIIVFFQVTAQEFLAFHLEGYRDFLTRKGTEQVMAFVSVIFHSVILNALCDPLDVSHFHVIALERKRKTQLLGLKISTYFCIKNYFNGV